MPIFKVGDWWYVRIEKGGKKYTPKSEGINMKEARWRKKSEDKLGEATLRTRVEALETTQTSLDLLTLCNEYLRDAEISCIGHDTFAGKKRLCRELLETWRNIPVENVTVHMAQMYLLDRANRVSNNSFNNYRKEGRRLFTWGMKQRLLPKDFVNPFAEIEKKKHKILRRGSPAIEHVCAVYLAAKADQKDLLLTYLITGARKSEILKLEWTDIDLEKRIYALSTGKTKQGEPKTTHHEMPPLLFHLLKRKFEKRNPSLPYVFWHEFWDRKRKVMRKDRYQNLNRFLERLCKRAKVPKFTLHQLRHLATAILKDKAGMSISQLQRFLRHEYQKTTEIYAGHLELGTKDQTDFLADFWGNSLNLAPQPSSDPSSDGTPEGHSAS